MVTRSHIHWLTEAGMFFEKSGPVWEALRTLQNRLNDAGIEYVVIGGIALNAYDYPRQTVDVDVVLRERDYAVFKERFLGQAYRRAEGPPRRFVDVQTEVMVDILIAGQLAGRASKNQSVRFPDPGEVVMRGDIHTVSLARLIELKIVTWRFKDWGDVVELIRRNSLTESFADQLDPTVRDAYLQCFDQATDEEYEAPQEN